MRLEVLTSKRVEGVEAVFKMNGRCCGTLTFDTAEWQWFGACLLTGFDELPERLGRENCPDLEVAFIDQKKSELALDRM